MKNRADKILLVVFLLTLAPYAAFFAYCFSELPLSITPPQQALLLYSHSIPMFFLQLLLCRTAKLRWRLLIPLLLLLIPGLVFTGTAGWHVIAWVWPLVYRPGEGLRPGLGGVRPALDGYIGGGGRHERPYQ